MSTSQNTEARYQLGFDILRQQYECQRQLTESSVEGVTSLVGAIIAWGNTEVGAIFEAVARIAGGQHLEPIVRDIISVNTGILWDRLPYGHYRLRA